ncbi:MAG: hypothetical protein H6709_18755 [Kofleriaceae bacterium]|nr:hypothetical protein [Myxococcales bacterium]MCB9564801.1 hypothetical protein [Kofleriaceae bacterium]MCB9574129.1 hypothetical protein [Kofleriaceae bacterium]
MTSLAAILLAAGVLLAGGCEKDQFKGAQAEVGRDKITPQLPPVPKFDLPPVGADGSHSVKEMRVKGRRFLDSEVTVKGVVTWIYDCATAVRTAEDTDDSVKKRITEDPTICRKPLFAIADSAGTPLDRSIKVVEVPRYPTDLEKKVLKDEVKDPTLWPPVPLLAVGDEVVVKGDWKQRSPHGEADSDGLLVYKSLENTTQQWSTEAALAALPPPKTKR